MHTLKRIAWFILGLPFAWLGLLGVPAVALALLDPIGTKAADDADPFGLPLSVAASVVLLLAYLVVGLLGCYCCYRGLSPAPRLPGRTAA